MEIYLRQKMGRRLMSCVWLGGEEHQLGRGVLRVIALFNSGIKGIHINVDDFAKGCWCFHAGTKIAKIKAWIDICMSAGFHKYVKNVHREFMLRSYT